ncbi:MAG: aminotransferase class I/II-fold pyridoxal phosphate-dependent enzyme [Saprospiraceae bacterium]|nr:aminotransferase class I/II-fold pyridoxal phosphate-dependent enzyme [Saprospiraceae bacterium]MBK7809670.1 aminotransferase class I/II-fold pyridoxal phosphate-dependent enzyme [Saprospiraceae bacterium]MBK9632219.1 aminotransferase class I/II-fold pyridoxal phosphate-dependent enzyme [Saprospiraceae bacterium]
MEKKNFETLAIRTQDTRSDFKEHSVPIYLSSSFVFDNAEALRAAFNEETDDFIYSRYSNPNLDELVQKVCLLEGAEDGVAFSSGMAAVFSSLFPLLNQGDHVLSCASIFGASHTLFTKYFPKYGISTSYFQVGETKQIESFIRPNTKIIYLESPTNPTIELLDLEYISEIAKKHQILLVVDNCFATPYLQQPIQFGADIIIHSATKYLDGQGRVLGGLAVGRKDLIREIYLFARISGPSMSAFNAWVISKSIETLALRMDRHSQNALHVATNLQDHPAIVKVIYPGLESHPQFHLAKKQMKTGGGILAFSLKGGYEEAQKWMDGLKMICISPNLGDSRSIATHPASSTHCKLTPEDRQALGITDGLIRISVGLENENDILEDILQAFNSVK